MTFLLILALYFIGIRFGTTKIFQKLGIPAWKAWVPVICSNEWQDLVGQPRWWTAMLFIPGVNLFYWAGQLTRMATAHGRTSFADHFLAVIAAPVYWPWLAYNDAIKYISPTGLKAGQKMMPKGVVREWADAIIFALVAATLLRTFIFEAYTIPTPSMEKTLLVGDFLFVSKFHYGARIPQTPLALPLVHHSLPGGNTPSYLEWIKLPYKRLPALQSVKRYDMVVFNFPAGDTVALERQEQSYYDLVRQEEYELQQMGNRQLSAFDAVREQYTIKARPVDKRENYIKRCVAVPGDKLEIVNGVLFINDEKAYEPENIYLPYEVTFKEQGGFSEEIMSENDIEKMEDLFVDSLRRQHIVYRMKKETVGKFKEYAGIAGIAPYYQPAKQPIAPFPMLFPNNFKYYQWNLDNFGPIRIPQKGMKLMLNDSTIDQYRRLIEVYEHNKLEVKDSVYYINGTATSEYICKMNYYWMMGDNRHNSADSRFWGFVPEDHVVGKAWFIWMSLNYNADLFHKIRWNRLFTNIHSKWAPAD
ncbi:MAG: signal peptidase I [Chitinophagales bacterium]